MSRLIGGEPNGEPATKSGFMADDRHQARGGAAGLSDLRSLGRLGFSQAWLAVSDDPGALVSGGYFYHRAPRDVLPAVRSSSFQDELLDELARLTGEKLPAA